VNNIYDLFGSNGDTGFVDGLMMVLGVLLIFVVIGLIVGLLMYIFESIGFAKMAYNRGMKNSWLAWVPIAREFLVGSIADDIHDLSGKKTVFRIIFPISKLVVFFFGGTVNLLTNINSLMENENPLASATNYMMIAVVSLAAQIVGWIILYAIYKDYSAAAIPMLIITIVFYIAQPFMVFAIRNKESYSIKNAEPIAESGYDDNNTAWGD
jgi:hypothetical protein